MRRQDHFVQTFAVADHGQHVLFLIGQEVDKYQTVFLFDRFQKRAFNIGFFVHADADVPVCFRQFDEIGQGIEIGFRFAVAVIQLLSLADHAEVAVV